MVQTHPPPLVKELRSSGGSSVFQLQRRGLCFTLPCKLRGFALLGSGAALEEEREVYLSWRREQHLAAIAATFV